MPSVAIPTGGGGAPRWVVAPPKTRLYKLQETCLWAMRNSSGTQDEPHLEKSQCPRGSGVRVGCSVVAHQGCGPSSLEFLPVPRRVRRGGGCPYPRCNVSQDLCSGSTRAGRKGLSLKPSSLLSPAQYFSTHSSGFLSI